MDTKGHRLAFVRETWVGRTLFDLTLILILLIFIELFSYGTALLYFKVKGRSIELANTQFLVGRFFQGNPVEDNTNARYLGHLGLMLSLPEWHVADPILGWRLGKDVGITQHHGHAEAVEWNFTNSQGFAPSDALSFFVDPKKPPGVFRIILFGGSAVEGMGARTPLDNLPSQFAQLIKKTARPKGKFTDFEVVNAGVSGYSTGLDYLYFVTELINYEPDLVIFYNGLNELAYWNGELRIDPDPIFPKRHRNHENWVKRLNESFTFFGALKHIFGSFEVAFNKYKYQLAFSWLTVRVYETLLPKNKSNQDFPLSNDFKKDAWIYEKMTGFYKSNVQDSIEFALSRNVQVAEFLQPVVGVDKKEYFPEAKKRIEDNPIDLQMTRNAYGYFREMVAEVSDLYKEQTNVCVADLSRYLENEKERLYVDAHAHLNGQGNAVMARGLRDKLIDCGMLELLPSES